MEKSSHERIIQSIDHNGDTHQVAVEQLRWRPSAYGVLVRGDSVLAVPHRNDTGEQIGYDLPGGGIDLGETSEAAVIRETYEETGLQVAKPYLLGAENSFFTMVDEGISVQAIMLYYACQITGGEITDRYQEPWERQHMAEPTWLPVDELAHIAVASSVDWRPYALQAIQDNQAS